MRPTHWLLVPCASVALKVTTTWMTLDPTVSGIGTDVGLLDEFRLLKGFFQHVHSQALFLDTRTGPK